MKKNIICVFSLILLSCTVKYNDLFFENLHGKVKSVRTNNIGEFSNELLTFNQKEISHSNSLKTYNKKGFLVLEQEFINHNKLVSESKYNYNGKLLDNVVRIDFDGDTLKHYESYIYNKRDSLIKVISKGEFDKSTIIFKHDKENYLTQIKSIYNGETILNIKYELDSKKNKIFESHLEQNKVIKTIKREFDINNRITKEQITEKESYGIHPYITIYNYSKNQRNSISYLEKTKDTIYTRENYNKKGKLIESIVLNKNQYSPLIKVVEIWNENSEQIEFSRLNEKNEYIKTFKYKFYHDRWGNWIKKVSYLNDTLVGIKTRHIEYY